MASTNVSFEISYTGPYSYQGDCDISEIGVKFEGLNREFSAHIDPQFKVSKEQILQLTARSATGHPVTVAHICAPTELAKTIKLSARIFQSQENLSISTPVFPRFEADKCYRIKVVNEENKLSATFVPIDDIAAEEEKLQFEAGMRMINGGLEWLNLAIGDVPRNDKALPTCQHTGQSDSALDTLEIPQLQALYEAAWTVFEEASRKLVRTLPRDNHQTIIQAVDAKEDAAGEVIKLARALGRKGIYVEGGLH